MHSRIMSGYGLGDAPNGCKNGVLNGILEVDIYMDEPEGFVQEEK